MKKIPAIILFFLISISIITGQSSHKKLGFISIHVGKYGVLSESFTRYYDSRFGYYLGGSLGIPLSERVSLFGKLSYFQKDGIPIYELSGLREGSAVLKEAIVNAGVQVKYFLSNTVNIIFSSGITMAIIDEERFAPKGGFTYEIEGNGNFGVFLGAALEINFGESPFSLVNELNYIYSWKPILEYENTYQAFNFSTGIRLYFGS